MFGKSALLVFTLVVCSAMILEASIEGTDVNKFTENVEPKNFSNTERSGRNLHKECNSSLSAKCVKIHVLSFLEDLSSRDELPILPGLSIVRENAANITSAEDIAAELSRQFPGKPDEKLNRFLLYRLQNYLDNHSLRYRLLDSKTSSDAMKMAKGDTENVGRKSGGGGGLGGGKGGGNGALLAAALMMKGTLAAAALGALALLAGKALMTALMSLLLSALVGLKGGGGKSTTYEIITKPEVSHHHSHSHEEHHEHEHGHHGGYRRAYDNNNYNNNYNSYMPYDGTT